METRYNRNEHHSSVLCADSHCLLSHMIASTFHFSHSGTHRTELVLITWDGIPHPFPWPSLQAEPAPEASPCHLHNATILWLIKRASRSEVFKYRSFIIILRFFPSRSVSLRITLFLHKDANSLTSSVFLQCVSASQQKPLHFQLIQSGLLLRWSLMH